MEIIGHQKNIDFLNKSLANEKMAHAYLFYGPEKIGKTKVAEYFITKLFCSGKKDLNSEPCGRCDHCRQILKHVHPDVFWLSNEPGEIIGVEQGRIIKEFIFSTPFSATYKAVIIEEADCLTSAAANSLLKLLEEPPLDSVIILISRDFNRLPSTIRSRCQILRFTAPLKREIENFLKNNFSLKGNQLEEILDLSHNLPGLAIEFAKNLEKLEQKRKMIEEIIFLLAKKDLESKLKLASLMLEIETNPEKNLDCLLIVLRELILFKNGLNFQRKTFNFLEKTKEIYSLIDLENFINQIFKTKVLIRANVNKKMALENLFINLN